MIGLDLGDGRLIERWADDGTLPALGRLFSTSGGSRELASTADTLHVSAWPSLYTGSSPGEHGVYFTFQPVPGIQGHRRFHEGLYGRPTFWNLLGRAGTASTVFDAPYTHPEPDSRASQVFDWGVWAKYLGERSSPPRLVRRLRKAVGAYPLGLEAHDVGLGAIPPEEIGPRLVEAAAARTRAALWLLEAAPAALFFLVYGETHPAAHYLWPAGLERSPEGIDPGAADDARLARLKAVYREIDRGIARILDAAPAEATVLVFSPDSIVANYGAWHLLPDVLRRSGYLHEPVPGESAEAPARPGLVRRIRDLLPRDFRKSLARYLPVALRDRLSRQVDTAFIDWSRTRAFCLPTDLEGLIRINLRGREPEGIVAPQDYDAVCDELSAALLALESPATGRGVVREVIRTRERLPGGRVDHLPDLIVLWEPVGRLGAVRSGSVGSVAGESPDARPGTHGTPGFLVASGPGADEWRRRAGHVQDMARLALEWFEVEAPGYMGSSGSEVSG